MSSPFVDEKTLSNLTEEGQWNVVSELNLETPLLDPVLVKENVEENKLQIENQVAPYDTIKIGDATLSIAPSSISSSKDYLDPVNSGNPLLVISPAERKLKISDNFSVGEFAQAESGKVQWQYARIDPVLVSNLQSLRTLLKRKIYIIDSYYSFKYLTETLKVTGPLNILNNPHVAGRGVKFSVEGHNNEMVDVAIAAIVACGDDVNISIGNSTLALYVKQLDDPQKKYTSYILREDVKTSSYGFCYNFSHLRSDQIYPTYGKLMEKATAELMVMILRYCYGSKRDPQWPDDIGKIISLMYKEVKDPEVILYTIAYSPLGNLMRSFLKDPSTSKSDTATQIKIALTRPTDFAQRNNPKSFLYLLNQIDKSGYIKFCYDRYTGETTQDKPSHLVDLYFFDWRNNADDKKFHDQLTNIIKQVYEGGGYSYQPAQNLPIGGTQRRHVISKENPDKPSVDFTGRYFVELQADPIVGAHLLINQAGNYVACKWVSVYNTWVHQRMMGGKTINTLKDIVIDFYGKLDKNGVAVCNFYPEKTIFLKKLSSGDVELRTIDNVTKKEVELRTFKLRFNKPILSTGILDAFTKLKVANTDLLYILAWISPLPKQLTNYFGSYSDIDKGLTSAIVNYTHVDETQPSVKRTQLTNAISALDFEDSAKNISPMFREFAHYYQKFFCSTVLWRPRNDRDFMTKLGWIRRVLVDYRDIPGVQVEKSRQNLYDFYDTPTTRPAISYEYEVRFRLNSYGVGPFARSSGTITIENTTDYNKYPNAQKWSSGNEIEFDVTLWNAQLSLKLEKWKPKLGTSSGMDGKATSETFYYESDFSGASVEITEGTAFEVPIEIHSSNLNGEVKFKVSSSVILIEGAGKNVLQFFGDDDLSDAVKKPEFEFTPADESHEDEPEILKYLPSLTMYKGEIHTRDTLAVIQTPPLPAQFAANYQLIDTRYFLHDDSTLTPAAVEAIGRLCADELAAFSDPDSVVDIVGHADASGDAKYNQELSEFRATNTAQAIKDRLGDKLRAKLNKPIGLGELVANLGFEFKEKNAWLRKVVIHINGRAVLSLGGE